MQCKKCGNYLSGFLSDDKCPNCGAKIYVKASITDRYPILKTIIRIVAIVLIIAFCIWCYNYTPSNQPSTNSQNNENVVFEMQDGRNPNPGGTRHTEAETTP